jgi:hypothetical protein
MDDRLPESAPEGLPGQHCEVGAQAIRCGFRLMAVSRAARTDQWSARLGEEAGWQADGLARCNGCQGEGCVLQEPRERKPGSTWLSLIGRSAAGFAWPRDSRRRNGCRPLSSGSPIFRQRPHHLLMPRLSRQAPVMPGSLPSSWPVAPGDVIGRPPLGSPGASQAAPAQPTPV